MTVIKALFSSVRLSALGLAQTAILVMCMLVGCSDYELRTITHKQPNVPSQARIVVFPLSPTPGFVSLPGITRENLYGRGFLQKDTLPEEQVKIDVENIFRGLAGMLISQKVTGGLRSLTANKMKVIYPLEKIKAWKDYAECVVGWRWGGLPEGTVDSQQATLDLRGLTAKQLAKKYNAEFLVWGDVSVSHAKSLVCRIVLYDKQGNVMWVSFVAVHGPLIGSHKMAQEIAFVFLGELPNKETPEWLVDATRKLGKLLCQSMPKTPAAKEDRGNQVNEGEKSK
ncbi:MAG: hypothetical protein K8S55_07610 [Phycisphaerae bacterium]|nr:hypothetical protein [Phycisphaerae bacterium]